MYTNADCTLYLYSKEGKNEKYTRFPVGGVYWEDVEQATFLKTGQRNACLSRLISRGEKTLLSRELLQTRLTVTARRPCQSHWRP